MSLLNDITTAHTTQDVCVILCMCVCLWVKSVSCGYLETVCDLQGFENHNLWSQEFTAVTLTSALCTFSMHYLSITLYLRLSHAQSKMRTSRCCKRVTDVTLTSLLKCEDIRWDWIIIAIRCSGVHLLLESIMARLLNPCFYLFNFRYNHFREISRHKKTEEMEY